jgi:GABA(A) receptor-associated protein
MNWLSKSDTMHTRRSSLNDSVFKIKTEKNLEERLMYSQTLMRKYPDRVPVIVEKNPDCVQLHSIERTKYLVPRELSVAQFIQMLRKHVKLDSSMAIFVLINNKLIPNTATISEVYATEKEEDGFMYVIYSLENTFG